MALIPFDDRDGFIWLDGHMVPWRDAKLHVLSHALHYASAVFEGERCYSGNIFRLRDHTNRLLDSGRILGFDIPWTAQQIDDACDAVVKANGFTEAYIRPIAWRGAEEMGVGAKATRIHLAIATWEWGAYFGVEQRMKGVRLDLAKWRRPAPDTAPTASKAAGLYMIGTMSKHGGGGASRRADGASIGHQPEEEPGAHRAAAQGAGGWRVGRARLCDAGAPLRSGARY
jgi:branched-chain amino acid aminotransferase